eukprot:TRINITY_DN710_c0_g2_i1.p1 TRINITY_DN710_c0_g2~~TRINITY_DN710_c0_g2_i1.p1  ORF type:complete len:315 (-),score=37.85 TRINITY_DN710_c0_g2_i1:78-1022(-)
MHSYTFLFLSFLGLVVCADPVPPTSFPPTWYTWMVTSVTPYGEPPTFSRGQLVAFDFTQQYSCRFLQQDLLGNSSLRPNDYCDATKNQHYRIDDTTGSLGPDPACDSTTSMDGQFSTPSYPQDYLNSATFIGVVKVNQVLCNHFYSSSVTIAGRSVQLDVFTRTDVGWPCQISVEDLKTRQITTWAFDGFSNVIPPAAKSCTAAQLLCAERNYTCQANPSATPAALQAALSWVCGVEDCSPINPGGKYYYPNTLKDHCNWAFNTYYLKYRLSQGVDACSFSGNAILAPPTSFVNRPRSSSIDTTTLFPLDLVCA